MKCYCDHHKKERLRLKKEQRKAAREGSDDEDAAAAVVNRAGKQGQARSTAEGAEGGFNVDLSDPRFSEMFQDHSFALDPTDPR